MVVSDGFKKKGGRNTDPGPRPDIKIQPEVKVTTLPLEEEELPMRQGDAKRLAAWSAKIRQSTCYIGPAVRNHAEHFDGKTTLEILDRLQALDDLSDAIMRVSKEEEERE